MTRAPDPALEALLRDVGAELPAERPSATLTEAVLARVADEPVPSRSPLGAATADLGTRIHDRSRWVAALVLGAVLSAGAISPVGAEIAEWFGFHGVQVRLDEDAPTGNPSVPPGHDRSTLSEASRLVDFRPRVPRVLGPPDQVEVSSDRRVLSMSWSADGAVRLDQFDAQLSPVFQKSARRATWVRVGRHDGLWFPVAHEVVLLGEAGVETTSPPRLAAQTLIWASGGQTFRLEGELSRQRAITIAESLR